MPIHIRPTAELAERVLLPGDPGRALHLAQALIDGPKMFNHNRGLWGYTGPARSDGGALTIQSTGMGGPSAAIVISELIDLGARRLIRVGTCGGLDPALELGELLVATEVICDDGTSRALGAGERLRPSETLTNALARAGGARAGAGEPTAAGAVTNTIVSTDLFYDAEPRHAQWRAAGARAVEMEAATLLVLAARREVEAAVLLLVSDHLSTPGNDAPPVRIDAETLAAAEIRLGEQAVAALAQSVQQSQPT